MDAPSLCYNYPYFTATPWKQLIKAPRKSAKKTNSPLATFEFKSPNLLTSQLLSLEPMYVNIRLLTIFQAVSSTDHRSSRDNYFILNYS